MSLVNALGYLGITTAQVSAWRTFAVEALGMALEEVDGRGTQAIRLDNRAARIVLESGGDEALAYMGWEVADPDALGDVTDALERAGYQVTSATSEELDIRQVSEMAWTRDPAGWRVEIAHGAAQRDDPPEFPHAVAGFETGALGLGHIVVQSPEAERSVAFYRDVLGLRLRDQLDDSLWFLGCNPRHHSIGIADIGGPARPLHLMVEVRELDDLGAAFDRCVDRGDQTSLLGLHSNDRMLSFYVRTPSGFEIEYGWNGLLVDDATWVATTIDRPSIWGHRQLDAEHPPTLRPFHARYRR